MSYISPRMRETYAPQLNVVKNPIVRDRIASVGVDPQSGYPPSQRTMGLCEIIQLQRDEKMSDRIAAAFFMLRVELETAAEAKGAKGKLVINEPEIFPVDERQTLVLMTGWLRETIILTT